MTDQYPSAVRPETEVVRIIESDDWATVMAGWLTAAGDATTTSDGSGYSFDEASPGGRISTARAPN